AAAARQRAAAAAESAAHQEQAQAQALPTAAPGTPGGGDRGGHYLVVRGQAKLREDPDAASLEVATLFSGDVVRVVAMEGKWVRAAWGRRDVFVLSENSRGPLLDAAPDPVAAAQAWAAQEETLAAAAAAAVDATSVAAAGATALAAAAAGVTAAEAMASKVAGRAAEKENIPVRARETAGKDEAAASPPASGDFGAASSQAVQSPAAEILFGARFVVVRGHAKLREEPDPASLELATLRSGDIVRVGAMEGKWARATYGGRNVFVLSENSRGPLLDAAPNAAAAAHAWAAQEEAALAEMAGRAAAAAAAAAEAAAAEPAANGPSEATAPPGDIVRVGAMEGKWARATYGGRDVFVLSENSRGPLLDAAPDAAAAAQAWAVQEEAALAEVAGAAAAAAAALADSTAPGVETAATAAAAVGPTAASAEREQGAASADPPDGSFPNNAADASGSSAAPQALPPTAAVTDAGDGASFMLVRGQAKLREEPDAASLELATLRSGDVVRVAALEGKWARATYGGRNVFVLSENSRGPLLDAAPDADFAAHAWAAREEAALAAAAALATGEAAAAAAAEPLADDPALNGASEGGTASPPASLHKVDAAPAAAPPQKPWNNRRERSAAAMATEKKEESGLGDSAAPGAETATAAEPTAAVAVAKLREEADPASLVLATLWNGDVVRVAAMEGKWARATHGGRNVFVLAENSRGPLLDAAPDAESAAQAWAAQEEAALASAAMAAAEAAAAAAAEVSADELVANGANEETVSSSLHEVVAAPAATPPEEPLTTRKQRPAATTTLGEERSGIGDSTVSGVEAAAAAHGACFMVVRGRAKLREEPDAASLELATLRSGDVVRVGAMEGKWARATFGGRSVFVLSENSRGPLLDAASDAAAAAEAWATQEKAA
ncbi:unnamed protein product, partial [Phaeothamnion confervicola]